MSYGYKTRIGYHLVDSNRKLTLGSLIDLLQDCGGFHGDDCGYSNKKLADMGLAWILSSWQVVVNKMPDLAEWVELRTYPYYYKHFIAHRYFTLKSQNNEEYVRANSIWVMMDMKQYKPVRITKEIGDAYGQDEDIFKGYDFGGRKIERAGEFTSRKGIEVAPYMIDTNHHVNNEQYVRIAQSFLPENYKWNTFRAEYTMQARLGDIMTPLVAADDNCCQIALEDANGGQYFIGEWKER